MKKNIYLIAILLVANLQLYAQKLQQKDLFSSSKIKTFLTDFNENQQKALSVVNGLRTKNIKEAKNYKEKKEINNQYYKKLIEILTKEQEGKLFGALINSKEIELQSKKEGDLKFKHFPLAYKEGLIKKLTSFNFRFSVAKNKYIYDFDQMMIEKENIRYDKNLFVGEEISKYKKVVYLINRRKNNCELLNSRQISLLRDYEFYISLEEDNHNNEINKITKNKDFISMLPIIARCEVEKKNKI